jgi:hypothetical protein
MRELLPFFFGCLVSPLVLRRSQPVRVVAAFVVGATASAINGELIEGYGVVFVLIDTTLAWLGLTLVAASVHSRRGPLTRTRSSTQRRRDVER